MTKNFESYIKRLIEKTIDPLKVQVLSEAGVKGERVPQGRVTPFKDPILIEPGVAKRSFARGLSAAKGEGVPQGRVTPFKLNLLAIEIIDRYISSSIELCKYTNKITVDSTCIITISSIWGIKDHIHDFASQVWARYDTPTVGIKKREKAGLEIPPVKIKKMFLARLPMTQKISETSFIFLAAIVEHLLVLNITHSKELLYLPHWLVIK